MVNEFVLLSVAGEGVGDGLPALVVVSLFV